MKLGEKARSPDGDCGNNRKDELLKANLLMEHGSLVISKALPKR